jgi:DNA-binding MarR family transcriptional regulator
MKSRSSSLLHLNAFMPFRLNRLASAMSEQLAEIYEARFGLDIPGWRVLATLGEFGEQHATFIARSTRMHKTRVSRAVASLAERGFVTSTEPRADRREVPLRLTSKGKRLYEQLVPLALARERELLQSLEPGERASFASTVSRLEKALGLLD